MSQDAATHERARSREGGRSAERVLMAAVVGVLPRRVGGTPAHQTTPPSDPLAEFFSKVGGGGVVVPGVIVSVPIAMIARSVSKLAHFSIREIAPVDHVSTIDTPALFIVGADDDFIPPHHSEDLCAAYQKGISTNLLMVPGGHNDARPQVVFDAVAQFLQYRLTLTDDMALVVPEYLQGTIYQRPPWAYASYPEVFQVHWLKRRTPNASSNMASNSTTSLITVTSDSSISATAVAEEFGMTQERQDDIQNKLHLMLGQGGGGGEQQPPTGAPPPPSGGQQQHQQQHYIRPNEVVATGVPVAPPNVPSSTRSQMGEEIVLLDGDDDFDHAAE